MTDTEVKAMCKQLAEDKGYIYKDVYKIVSFFYNDLYEGVRDIKEFNMYMVGLGRFHLVMKRVNLLLGVLRRKHKAYRHISGARYEKASANYERMISRLFEFKKEEKRELERKKSIKSERYDKTIGDY